MITRLMFLFLIGLLNLSVASVPSNLTGELTQCTSDLRRSVQYYRQFIPAMVLAFDRRLTMMAEGVSYLEENTQLTVGQFNQKPGNPAYRLWIANAVEGCKSYQKRFQARAKHLLFLALSVTASVLCLALGYLLNLIPRSNAHPR
ncbi:MAG: hypothetical protein HY537_15150 [Deltaproteobacteria bacterium]|nr:hypothetical protein [Deltaproteobacteria bacterium]